MWGNKERKKTFRKIFAIDSLTLPNLTDPIQAKNQPHPLFKVKPL